MIRKLSLFIVALAAAAAVGNRPTFAAMQITEWQYNGSEYVEFTNIGGPAVDMTGWSFDDNSRTAGSFSLSSFGLVQPGQSVVLSEEAAAAFRTRWNLSASVSVIGLNDNNLGRSDEINLYNGTTLVDRLTYNDQGAGDVAGPQTSNVSGNPLTLSAVGVNKASLWKLSVPGDVYGSYTSATGGFIGNPGVFSLVPEPAAWTMAAIAMTALVRRRKS